MSALRALAPSFMPSEMPVAMARTVFDDAADFYAGDVFADVNAEYLAVKTYC